MSTPTYCADDVRRYLIAQVETLDGFKHARLFWGGVAQQGAQIGTRTFDIREGATAATGIVLANVSEQLQTEFVLRLRHPVKPKQDANEAQDRSRDVRNVANRAREENLKIPPAIQIFWVSSDAPALAENGAFVETDLKFVAKYFSWVKGPPDAVGVQK